MTIKNVLYSEFKFLALKVTSNFQPRYSIVILIYYQNLIILGRAGMAAINDPDNRLNLTTLAAGLAKSLPSYARPLFIRVLEKIDMTGEKC